MADVRTLHVVARNSDGRIVHRPIGRALVVADFDAGLTTLALRAGLEPLASFLVDSPSEAADAIETLDELGDVDFDPSDFAPRWFDPAECLATIDGLEHLSRQLPADVCQDIASVRLVLLQASRQGWMFHLVELLPEEEVGLKPLVFEG